MKPEPLENSLESQTSLHAALATALYEAARVHLPWDAAPDGLCRGGSGPGSRVLHSSEYGLSGGAFRESVFILTTWMTAGSCCRRKGGGR